MDPKGSSISHTIQLQPSNLGPAKTPEKNTVKANFGEPRLLNMHKLFAH